MKNSENSKKVYLSENIDKDYKYQIIRAYFHEKSRRLIGDREKKFDEKIRKILEDAYTRKLGDNWEEIVEKYNVPRNYQSLIHEDFEFPDCQWGDEIKLVYNSPKEYPVIKDSKGKYFNPIDSYRGRPKLLKELMEIIEVKYEIYKSMVKSGAIIEVPNPCWGDKLISLPGVNTYEDLKKKYPEIFEFWIQYILRSCDNVEIISKETETEILRQFIQC